MLRVSVLSLFTILLLSFPLDSQEICLKDLIEKPGLFDNQEIEVEAEVLDIFANREGCWINISDNTQSLGAWVEKGRPIPYIEHFGSYEEEGDLVRITGTFNSSCPRHLGQRDIHVKGIYIVKKGRKIRERAPIGKRNLAIFWFILCLVIFIIYLIKKLLVRPRKPSVS